MAKFRIKVKPTGYINGLDWPEVGETIDLPAAAGDDMVEAGILEAVKAEKKTAEKKVEKRPASNKGEEKR